MPSSQRETAISAIETVLHAGTSNEMRMQATQWLEGVVESDDGWVLLMSLLDEEAPDVRMKAAILVKNKIKKTSERLDVRAANSMAGIIYEKLVKEGTSPSSCAQVIINHLIVSLVLVLVRVPESSDSLIPRLVTDLSTAPSSLTMILRVIADEITVLRQAIPSHASETQQHEVFGPIFALGKSLKRSSRDVLSLVEKSVVEKGISLLEGLKWFSAWVPYLEVEVSGQSQFMNCIFAYNKDMQPAEKETIIESLKALSKKCSVGSHEEMVKNILKLTEKIARLLEPDAVVGCAAIATNYSSHLIEEVARTQQPHFLITFLSTYASECLAKAGKDEVGEFLNNITPFWTEIRKVIKQINDRRGDSKNITSVLHQPMMNLLQTTLKNFEIEDDHRDDDDANLPCLLRDIAFIIKPSVFFSTILNDIFNANLPWKPLEARIASLTAVSSLSYEVWEENSQALCSMLPKVSTPDCHPAIRAAYCALLFRVSFAFASDPEQLRAAVELLLVARSFKSLSRVCLSHGKEMAADPQIMKMMADVWTSLSPDFVSPDGTLTSPVEILSDCIWLVLSKYAADAMSAHVSNLLQAVIASIKSQYTSGHLGRTCFELEKLQFLIKKSKTWKTLQPSTSGDVSRENIRNLWTRFFEPVLNVVFPCLQQNGVPGEIVSASAGCVAGLALVSISNFQQWLPVLERLQVIASKDPHPELFSVVTEIARLFCHDEEASKGSVRFISSFLTSACNKLSQAGDPNFSDVQLSKAVFKMLSELLKRSVIIDSKSRRSSLAIALMTELVAPLAELTCQAMKSSVVVEPELVRHVLTTCDAMLQFNNSSVMNDFGPELTAAAVVAISNKPSESLGQLTKILNHLKKSNSFHQWITQAFTSANLGLQASVIQQFTATVTMDCSPSTKPAVEGLFKAVHSQAIFTA